MAGQRRGKLTRAEIEAMFAAFERADPERAWALITSLRSEVSTLKADRDSIRTERDAMAAEKSAAEDAKKDDLTRATDRLTAAEKAAALSLWDSHLQNEVMLWT